MLKKAIQRCLIEEGLTKKQLAAEIGISVTMLRYYIRNTVKKYPVTLIDRVKNYLGEK